MLKLTLTAASLESAAIGLLLARDSGWLTVLLFLIAHGGASLLMALVAWMLLRRTFEDDMRWPTVLLASIAFFIPVVGMVGFLIGLALALWAPRITMFHPFNTIAIPEFAIGRSRGAPRFRSSSIRDELADSTLSQETRLRALISVQEMPGRTSSGLLRDLLADPVDDIRLLAYGMLRGKERAIGQRVTEAIERFNGASSEGVKYAAAKELAELNWELVYQNLVVGDLRRHALQQGFSYAIQAIRVRGDEPGIWFITGKLAFVSGLIPEARNYLRTAVERGFPRLVALPYIAECAFAERDFEEVRTLLAEMPREDVMPKLSPIVDFWSTT